MSEACTEVEEDIDHEEQVDQVQDRRSRKSHTVTEDHLVRDEDTAEEDEGQKQHIPYRSEA